MLIEALILAVGIHLSLKKFQRRTTENSNASKEAQPADTSLVPIPLSRSEVEANHNFRISWGLIVTTSTAALLASPLLTFLNVIGLFYLHITLFKKALAAIFIERKARIEVIDFIAFLTAISLRYYVLSAIGATMYYGAEKLKLLTEHKSKQSIVDVFGQHQAFVWVVRGETEVQIPFESLTVDDIVVVNAGEIIPADGIVVKGIASVDQHLLTGEAQLLEKTVGEKVFAVTVVLSGTLRIQVEKTGQETIAAKMGEVLQNTSEFINFVESKGQEIADKSVVPYLLLSLGAYPLVGFEGTTALLYSDFFVNMRLMTPIGMLNFLHTASQEGILIKDGRSLELLRDIDTVIFDKTGTLTLEQPQVHAIYPVHDFEENQLLLYAALAEYRQTHPIAKAILQAAADRHVSITLLSEAAHYKIGYGITVRIKQQLIQVGSERFMEMEGIDIPAEFSRHDLFDRESGHTWVYVAVDRRLAGVIELQSTLRPEVKEIIQLLKQRNLSVYIISGDHSKPTQTIANLLGVDHYFAEVLPKRKAELVEHLQAQGKRVCFVGDGINDAIALKKANVSISLRGATTVATDSAQIVLMDESLKKLPTVFEIGHRFQDNLHHLLTAVVVPSLLGIGGVFFASFRIPVIMALYSVSTISGILVAMLPRSITKTEEHKSTES